MSLQDLSIDFLRVVWVILVALSPTFTQGLYIPSDLAFLESVSHVANNFSQFFDYTDQVNVSSKISGSHGSNVLPIITIVLLIILLMLCGVFQWCYLKETSSANSLAQEGLIMDSWDPNLNQGKASSKRSKAKRTASDYLPASLDNATQLPSLKSEEYSQTDKKTLLASNPATKRSSYKGSSVKGSVVKGSKGKGSVTKGSKVKKSGVKKPKVKKSSRKKSKKPKKSTKNNYTTKAVKLKLESAKSKSKKPKTSSHSKRSKRHSIKKKKSSRRDKRKSAKSKKASTNKP